MAVTLRDVARHAGVSTRTVSNVVNDFAHVSPGMRAKVQAALDELGYRPNLLARGLRQGRTGIVGLLLPQIAVPYFGELAHEIVERAGHLGLTVTVDETGGRPDRELALLELASHSQRVDGVLLSSQGLQREALTGLRPEVPVVLLGERTARTHDHVAIDNVAAAREATAHLLATGRTRIAAVGGQDSAADATSRLRLAGYRAALREAGLPEDAVRHAPTTDYTRSHGVAAARWLLARRDPPDGLVCLSDELAAGALRELHDQGAQVPGDVAVVGFDDVDSSRYATPSLTSVSPDKALIARTALDLLVERIGGSTVPPRDVRVPHTLATRESSAPG